MRTTIATSCGLALAGLWGAPLSAQTPAGASDPNADAQIADIVVTANRRQESVQQSALAIQAFDAESLEQAGLSQPADLNKLVQGLQLATNGSNTQIYVRGIGDFSANPLSNPGVAFNVDGVYVGRPEAVGSQFYDIARLEVVKGPQGTLYGRNATGGAINLITNAPTFGKLGGNVSLELGSYDLFRMTGALNAPLSDTLALRIAANRVSRDGFLSDGTNDDDQLAGRVKLLFAPSSDVSLLLSVDGARVRGRGAGFVYRRGRPGSDAWEGTADPAAQAYLASFNPVILPPDDIYIRNDFWNASAQLDWNLGFATLTIIPAYRHNRVDSQIYKGSRGGLSGKADQETIEARLNHDSPGLSWVAGLYYFHEQNPGEIRIFVAPQILRTRIVYRPEGTSYAAFGETTLGVADGFRLIAGARYTTEKRVLGGNYFSFPNGATTPVNLETFDGQKRFSSVTWKVGAEYDVAPRSLLFFTAGTGFKSGGLTQTVFPGNIYQPEKILAFEFGSRNRFLDNRLQVNFEAFHWTYKNQQNNTVTYDTLGVLNVLTQNAGRAKIYGANLDIVAKPTSADTLRLAGEYVHSKYSEFSFRLPAFAFNPVSTGCRNAGVGPGPVVPLATVDCSGFQLPHVPKWSGTIDYTHAFALGSGATIEANANARYASSTWIAVDFSAPERASAFAIANASLSYIAPDRAFSLTAYVRNINNGKEYTGATKVTAVAPLVAATISPPRTYGVQAKVNF